MKISIAATTAQPMSSSDAIHTKAGAKASVYMATCVSSGRRAAGSLSPPRLWRACQSVCSR